MFAIANALHEGYTVDRIWQLTRIDKVSQVHQEMWHPLTEMTAVVPQSTEGIERLRQIPKHLQFH